MSKKVSWYDYLWLALYAVAGFSFELILVQIENIFNLDINDMTTIQYIIHWVITIIAWSIIGFIITKIGKKSTGFDIWKSDSKKVSTIQLILLFICIIINIVAKYIDWNGFKVLLEFKSRGPILFIFQYLYYVAEGFLISLVIVYGQKACELLFKNEKVPYGGIILGLTWGLGHIVSKCSIPIGILSACAGLLFGSVYLLMNKDYKKSLPLIIILFMI